LLSVVVVAVAAGTVIYLPHQVSVAVWSLTVHRSKLVEPRQLVHLVIRQIRAETVFPIRVQAVVAVVPICALEVMVAAVAVSSRSSPQAE
jgi:hypothetical protein